MSGTLPYESDKSYPVGIKNVAEDTFEEGTFEPGLLKLDRAENGKLYAFGATPLAAYIFDFTTNQRSDFPGTWVKNLDLRVDSQEPVLYLDQSSHPQILFSPSTFKKAALLDQSKSELIPLPLDGNAKTGAVRIGSNAKGHFFVVALDRENIRWNFTELFAGAQTIGVPLEVERTRSEYHLQDLIRAPHGTFLAAWENTQGNVPVALHVASVSSLSAFKVDLPKEFNITEKLWSAVRYIDGSYLMMMRNKDKQIALYQVYGPE